LVGCDLWDHDVQFACLGDFHLVKGLEIVDFEGGFLAFGGLDVALGYEHSVVREK